MLTWLTAAALASCTASVPQSGQLPQSSSRASVQPNFGKVVSVRRVTFPAGQTARIAALNAVLTALDQEIAVPPVTGEEIIIQKDDGNPASLVQQGQSTSLEIGDRVVVSEDSPVAIIARN